MNAGSPVAPGSCLSLSSPSKFPVRQALAPNVCFHSVLSPCRCLLPLSPAAGNTSFFHSSHGRRKHSKFVLVVKGSSSTFEESKAQVAEPERAKAEPAVRGRVSWSADGKPTILWAAPKQRGRGGFPNGERQLNGGQSFKKEAEPTGKPDARHGSHVPSAGEQKEFILPKHRQSTAHLVDAIAVPKSPSTRHSDIFSPSSASRLLIGSNAPKQKAETDALTSPMSHVQRARTSLTGDEYNQFQGGAPANGIPLRKEDDHQGGPVFKSKLEEILNEFRNRQQREEKLKDKKARKNNPEDISKEGGDSSPGSVSHVRRRETASTASLSWKSARRDHQNNDYGGMNDANFSHENFDAVEDHGNESNEKGIFITRHQNRAYIQTDHEPLDLPNSSLRTSQRSTRGLSPVVERHRFIRDKNSKSLVGQASEYKPRQNNSSKYHSKSTGKVWVNDKQEHLASSDKFYERPYKDGKNHQPQFQLSRCNGENFDEEGSNNTALHNESDSEDDSMQKKDSTAGLKTVKKEPLVNYKPMQNNSSKFHSKSKGKVWVNDKKGRLASNDEAIERPYKDGMNYRPQFQMSETNGENFDEEGGNNTADSEGDSRQNKDPSAGLKTVKNEPLVANGKATWHSQSNSSLPFEYQYSYSEVPNAPILRYREKPFSPFGPQTMSRPWTGGPPLKKNKRNVPLFDSFNPPPKGKRGVKYVQNPGPYRPGQGPKPAKTRDEILGEPLKNEEIAMLIDSCQAEKRQLNLGRDGLTHNMLDLIHCHWKRRRVIKVRCLGVPTIDMDNVCFHLEDKTGGKIIYCSGGNVYLFRGRNYNYKDRPEIPLMLWKPISPVYPRLIQRAPGGLTEEEADQLRELGKKVEPLCRLSKNGIYYKLVDDVRVAFKVDKIVRIDCRGLNPSDYKKIGAKLKDLVPCVLLSFDNEQILMWKGKEISTDPGSLKESATEGTTEESFADDTGQTPIRDLEDIKTDLTGATVQIHRAELIKDNFPPGGHVGTRYGHKAFEQDSYKPNLLSQDAHVQVHSITPPDGTVDNTRVLPADTWSETNSYSQSPFWTEGQENQRAPLQVIDGLLSSETSPGNMESGGVAEKDPSDTHNAAHFNDLWDEAITSGIAVQLDAAEMDNDTVVTRARKLAAEVPAGEEYTRTLIKSLQIRAPRIAQPSQQLHKHLRRIRKMKLEKKLAKQRPLQNQRTGFEDFRLDGQGRGGMHVDELAQLLSMK